ncbi:protein kinase [Nocardiopsis sp. L17-MgMaSL7]|uniref:protein kinase domain-containing protein n=1 Tax=Nocardiopsis sp. L17-MgMaSL7 TaxID=1938893 RepID=UPI000D712C4B|nr:protein kinase [Nocardiopsis sp. L17-MgMaSL7]PWV47210.1 serine/threonine protein kinase [Nocardiopsis sp. L17-MgMaSL7]
MSGEEQHDRLAPGFHSPEVLHRGAASTVYRARRDGDDAPVALKVMRDGSGAREVDRLVELSGIPGLVGVVGGGRTSSGRAFVAMNLHPGDYATALKSRGPLPVGEVLAVGRSVAGALAALHARGLLHHRVQPGNILGAPEGAVLADVGGVLTTEERPEPVGLDPVAVAYASPEALSGQYPLTPASDIYRLAAVLWTLLAGYPPFAQGAGAVGDPFTYRERALAEDPPRLPRADLPVRLRAVLDRALSREPGRRQDATELARDLAGDAPAGVADPGAVAAESANAWGVPGAAPGGGIAGGSVAGSVNPVPASQPQTRTGAVDSANAWSSPVLGQGSAGSRDSPEAEEPGTRVPRGLPAGSGAFDSGATGARPQAQVAESANAWGVPGAAPRTEKGLQGQQDGLRTSTPQPEAPGAGADPDTATGSGVDPGAAGALSQTGTGAVDPSSIWGVPGAAPGPGEGLTKPLSSPESGAPEDTGVGVPTAPEPQAEPGGDETSASRPDTGDGGATPASAASLLADHPEIAWAALPGWAGSAASEPQAADSGPGAAGPDQAPPGSQWGPAQPPAPPEPPKPSEAAARPQGPTTRRPLFIGVTVVAIAFVAITLGAVAVLRPGAGGDLIQQLRPEAAATPEEQQPQSGGETGNAESPDPPAPPAGLVEDSAPSDVVLEDTGHTVTVTWTDNTDPAAAHQVIGGPAGETPGNLADAEPGSGQAKVSGLDPGRDYCFVVIAVLSVDEIAPSEQACTERATAS